jgi:hypothetical protein
MHDAVPVVRASNDVPQSHIAKRLSGLVSTFPPLRGRNVLLAIHVALIIAIHDKLIGDGGVGPNGFPIEYRCAF